MENEYEYTVQEGYNLSSILFNTTGSVSKEAYEKLARENGIDDPNIITVGQKIKIGNEYFENNSPSSSQSKTSENSNISSTVENDVQTSNDNLFETENQSEFEQLFSSSNSKSLDSSSENSKKANENVDNILNKQQSNKMEKEINLATQESNSPINIANTEVTFTPSDYEICYISSVKGWVPRNSFKTFQIKENAGEHFVQVNNLVKKCCIDIDNIISSLNILKNKMGVNTGTTNQIEKITKHLSEKKQDLITKNTELIKACNEVINYVYLNKKSKTEEASQVSEIISRINIYMG